jgi:hypothetical protein
MMMSKGSVLLTAEDLLRWREEDGQLDEQIRQLQQKRAEVKRKLDAAEVFAERLSAVHADAEMTPRVAVTRTADADGDSAPKALCENMARTGDSLKVNQIKQRLIEIGFAEKVKAQPNYHYQLVYRLTKSGRLLRRGERYRAAPKSSPQGETEAVGASVHIDGNT